MSLFPHKLALLPDALQAHARAHGIALRDDEARRLVAATFQRKGEDPTPRPVSRAKQEALAAITSTGSLTIVERATDPSDGFVKYLFRAPDGVLFEAVRIPLHVSGRFTVCLSSQVGCAMACSFCATGRLGLTRNLRSWEMVASFLAVRDEAPGRVTGALFQGQGEPFQNYDEVIRAAQILSHPCGGHIAARAITISTVGVVPAIHRFASERHPYRLIVSITSAVQERRARLLPVASRASLADLAASIREVHLATGQRITLAWVLIGGQNHDERELVAIESAFAGIPIRVNLIDVNDAGDSYRRATDDERHQFIDRLAAARIPFIRRYSGGRARHAACGMLASVQDDRARATPPE